MHLLTKSAERLSALSIVSGVYYRCVLARALNAIVKVALTLRQRRKYQVPVSQDEHGRPNVNSTAADGSRCVNATQAA